MTDKRERTPNPPTPEDAPATLGEAARKIAEAMGPPKLLRKPSQEATPETPEVNGTEEGSARDRTA